MIERPRDDRDLRHLALIADTTAPPDQRAAAAERLAAEVFRNPISNWHRHWIVPALGAEAVAHGRTFVAELRARTAAALFLVVDGGVPVRNWRRWVYGRLVAEIARDVMGPGWRRIWETPRTEVALSLRDEKDQWKDHGDVAQVRDWKERASDDQLQMLLLHYESLSVDRCIRAARLTKLEHEALEVELRTESAKHSGSKNAVCQRRHRAKTKLRAKLP